MTQQMSNAATVTARQHRNGKTEPTLVPADGLSTLARIAQRASDLDQFPRFPSEDFGDLRRQGVLQRSLASYSDEVGLIRSVARVNASTARILDGHLNGLERLRLSANYLPEGELEQIRRYGLLLGVWGADPATAEGEPARLIDSADGWIVRGVKTYCSGAGGVDRALIVAADADGLRRLVYLDAASDSLKIDRDWYRASGLRASESHRVTFHDTPVIAVLGEPDELAREPYLSRDAIRTSATWAGLVDCIACELVKQTRARPRDQLQSHLLGKVRVARATIDRWLDHTVSLLNAPAESGTDAAISTALECRIAISECARSILTWSAELGGSRALTGASTLDRARRDLDLFLLQHRLGSKLTSLGDGMLDRERP